MAVTDLAEFLLARIAEDEAEARAVVATPIETPGGYWETRNPDYGEIALAVDPARVVAQCQANRRIVKAYGGAVRPVLCLLALPYGHHPDYDEAWRP